MPHIGRNYPYLPEYWATEAWFWPGFVPWKLVASFDDTIILPWFRLTLGWTGVSQVYSLTDDCKEVTYQFPLTLRNGDDGYLLVRLRKVTISSVNKAEWYMVVIDDGVPFAEGYAWQPFPQRVVYVDTWDVGHDLPSGTDCLPPPLTIRPATYEEGGSPFPDDDGGGIPP